MLEDLIELLIASHQPRTLGKPRPVPLGARRLNVGTVRAEQSLRECLCGLRRPDVEFAVKDLGALVIRADGARPVASVGLQLHQRAVSDPRGARVAP